MTTDGADQVQAIAEAVVDVLAQRGLVVDAGPIASARILKVGEVARRGCAPTRS